MGAKKLAWKLGIPEWEAQEFIDAYHARYPGIKRYINKSKIDAYRIGYVETIIGRKRRLPEARSSDKIKSSLAEREAVNARIQGSVADMVKMAALAQEEIIVQNSWPFELLLQIHDELLYEVPRVWLEHHQSSLQQLKFAMETVYPLLVPVEVSLETLTRWGNKTVLDEYEEE
jgi:DNA polymerase-1